VNGDSTSSLCAATLDPQIAIATVAILGAVTHAIVAILRGLQDFKHGTGERRSRAEDSAE
jgi:hypothetical protein